MASPGALGAGLDDWRTGVAIVLVLLFGSLSTTAGVGGGVIFVPLLQELVQLELKDATVLSQALIAAGSVVTVALNLFRRSPVDPAQTLTDFHLAAAFTPTVLVGTAVGVILNIVFPAWLVTLLFMALMPLLILQSTTKGLAMWRSESRARARAAADAEEAAEEAAGDAGEEVAAGAAEDAGTSPWCSPAASPRQELPQPGPSAPLLTVPPARPAAPALTTGSRAHLGASADGGDGSSMHAAMGIQPGSQQVAGGVDAAGSRLSGGTPPAAGPWQGAVVRVEVGAAGGPGPGEGADGQQAGGASRYSVTAAAVAGMPGPRITPLPALQPAPALLADAAPGGVPGSTALPTSRSSGEAAHHQARGVSSPAVAAARQPSLPDGAPAAPPAAPADAESWVARRSKWRRHPLPPYKPTPADPLHQPLLPPELLAAASALPPIPPRRPLPPPSPKRPSSAGSHAFTARRTQSLQRVPERGSPSQPGAGWGPADAPPLPSWLDPQGGWKDRWLFKGLTELGGVPADELPAPTALQRVMSRREPSSASGALPLAGTSSYGRAAQADGSVSSARTAAVRALGRASEPAGWIARTPSPFAPSPHLEGEAPRGPSNGARGPLCNQPSLQSGAPVSSVAIRPDGSNGLDRGGLTASQALRVSGGSQGGLTEAQWSARRERSLRPSHDADSAASQDAMSLKVVRQRLQLAQLALAVLAEMADDLLRVPRPEAALLAVAWVGFVVLQVMRSAVVPLCSAAYWGVLAAQLGFMLLLSALQSFIRARRHASIPPPPADADVEHSECQAGKQGEEARAKPGPSSAGGEHTVQLSTMVIATSCVAGVVGGLLGLGGGLVMGPLMLELGVPPQVSAATSSLMVLFSSSAALLSFAVQGRISAEYVGVYGAASMASAALGVLLVGDLIRRSGRPSVIVFCLCTIMVLGFVSVTSRGVPLLTAAFRDGQDRGFHDFCAQ